MPLPFALDRFRRNENDVYIETGLKTGNSLIKAIKAGFRECYSIELDNGYCEAAREHPIIGPATKTGQATLIEGESGAELPKLLSLLPDRRIVFFLDAHSGRGGPLRQELDAIMEHTRRDHTILIDDVRHWKRYKCDFGAVLSELLNHNPDWQPSLVRCPPVGNAVFIAE